MGGGFSAVLEPLQSVVKSVGDGFKGVKLPDNPFKDVSLGNKGRNFLKGVSSGIIGPRKASVQVSSGSLFGPRTYQTRSVSTTPMSVSGIVGDFFGHKISRFGRTGTKPIFSSNKSSLFNRIKNKIKPSKKPNSNPVVSSNESSFVERMRKQFKPSKKPNNIGTSNISQIQQFEQPPQKTQEEFPTQIKGGSKKKPSENKKKPSENKKNPSENKKKPSKKEKKPSENKKKPSEKKKKPSENKKKPSEKKKKPSENKTKSKK